MTCLEYKERLVRQQQIESLVTIDETFTWLWSSSFYTWLQSSSPLFWISGKPASGKSTLMSYIVQNLKTLKTLEKAHGYKWQLIHHYFDFRAGESLGNNFEGLLRTLLFQLCEKDPDLSSRVPELMSFLAQPSETWLPSVNTLYQALRRAIEASVTRLLVLLDGLDEYDGNKVELVTLINTLGSQYVKFCLASRADPPFSHAFHGVPSFEMRELNTPGIRAFAAQTLQNFFSRSACFDDSALDNVAEDIAQRSRGVFLWVRFTIFELIDGFIRGEALDSKALRRRLEQVPQELQDIYSRIFCRGTQHDRETAGLVLLLVTSAQQELGLPRFHEAVSLLPRDLAPFRNSILNSFETHTMTGNTFKTAVLAATGGTIETYTSWSPNASSPLIRLSHRTVKSYLDIRGWRELLQDEFFPGLGHELWLRICVKVLPLIGPSTSRLPEGVGMGERTTDVDVHCLRKYVLLELTVHEWLFEHESQKSLFPSLSPILTLHFVEAHQKAHGSRGCSWCCSRLPSKLVH